MAIREIPFRWLAGVVFVGAWAGLAVSAWAEVSNTATAPELPLGEQNASNDGPSLGQETAATNDEPAPEISLPTPQPAIVPLSPDLLSLRDRLRKTLKLYHPKHLDVRQRSCWEVMHGIIAYGVDAKLFRDGPGTQKVNAVGWMCYNQLCHGESLFYLDQGKLVARQGPGLQGHLGQFLAIIAQSHVPADFPMKVSGKNFTVQDLIDHEKSDCRDGEELTFKLIGLSHYLDSDAQWITKDGQKWNIQRLIREELKQPILRVAACGGTHRLMGNSYAVYKRRKQGKPIDGQFARAEKFIGDFQKYAWSLQNSDGTFSTRWFEGREAKPDLDRRIKTTGHTTEWMAFSLPEEQLTSPRMIKAITFLVNALQSNVGHEWEVGPHGHAIHALRIYDRRLFKPYDSLTPPTPVEPPKTVERKSAETPVNTSRIDTVKSNEKAVKPEPVRKAVKKPAIDPLQTATRPSHRRGSRPVVNTMTPEAPRVNPPNTNPAAIRAPEVPPIEMMPELR